MLKVKNDKAEINTKTKVKMVIYNEDPRVIT